MRLTGHALHRLFFLSPLVLACCSSSAEPATPAPAPAATGSAAAADGGAALPDAAPPVGYPAFPLDLPQIVSRGGHVLASPKLALLTYAGDPLAAVATRFVSGLGASHYWATTTSEYGVGPASALPTVTLTETAPATIDDAAIRTWLASEVDGTHPDVPAPDGQTLYIIIYPQGTVVTQGTKTSCKEIGGYHGEAKLAASGSVPYVVMPRCATFADQNGQDELTFALSHELVEAALNPFITSAPAFDRVDVAHLAWEGALGQAEPGDMCLFESARSPDFDFTVQRTWSNASAKAGHDPCVPRTASPYFEALPVMPDSTVVDGASLPSVKIPVGQSATIDVHLASDGPIGDWKVSVLDVASKVYQQPEQLSFALADNQGHNGDSLRLTIRAQRAGRTGTIDGLSSFLVVSTSSDGRTSIAAAFVAN